MWIWGKRSVAHSHLHNCNINTSDVGVFLFTWGFYLLMKVLSACGFLVLCFSLYVLVYLFHFYKWGEIKMHSDCIKFAYYTYCNFSKGDILSACVSYLFAKGVRWVPEESALLGNDSLFEHTPAALLFSWGVCIVSPPDIICPGGSRKE